MENNENDFWIQCIASIIGIVSICLPQDMYILKIICMIIFNILIWRNQIKKLLLKCSKKDSEKLGK